MIHVAGKVDPVEDIDVINFELALADITQIEKRLERIAKGRAKTKEEIASNEVQLSLPSCYNRLKCPVKFSRPMASFGHDRVRYRLQHPQSPACTTDLSILCVNGVIAGNAHIMSQPHAACFPAMHRTWRAIWE